MVAQAAHSVVAVAAAAAASVVAVAVYSSPVPSESESLARVGEVKSELKRILRSGLLRNKGFHGLRKAGIQRGGCRTRRNRHITHGVLGERWGLRLLLLQLLW